MDKLGDSCNTVINKPISQNKDAPSTPLKIYLDSTTQTAENNFCENSKTTANNNQSRLFTQLNQMLVAPNMQLVQNVSGPPIHYIPMPVNNMVTNGPRVINPVMQSSIANSRTPWSAASKQKSKRGQEHKSSSAKDRRVFYPQNRIRSPKR